MRLFGSNVSEGAVHTQEAGLVQTTILYEKVATGKLSFYRIVVWLKLQHAIDVRRDERKPTDGLPLWGSTLLMLHRSFLFVSISMHSNEPLAGQSLA